jgi:hypothetical protein
VKALASGFVGAVGRFLGAAAGAFVSLNLVFGRLSFLPSPTQNWLTQEGIGPLPWAAVLWLSAVIAGAILGVIAVRVASGKLDEER